MEKQKVWIITSNYCSGEYGCGETVLIEGCYTKAEDARLKFDKLCDEMYMEAIDLYDQDELDEEKCDGYYSIWVKNNYDSYHFELRMCEKEIN